MKKNRKFRRIKGLEVLEKNGCDESIDEENVHEASFVEDFKTWLKCLEAIDFLFFVLMLSIVASFFTALQFSILLSGDIGYSYLTDFIDDYFGATGFAVLAAMIALISIGKTDKALLLIFLAVFNLFAFQTSYGVYDKFKSVYQDEYAGLVERQDELREMMDNNNSLLNSCSKKRGEIVSERGYSAYYEGEEYKKCSKVMDEVVRISKEYSGMLKNSKSSVASSLKFRLESFRWPYRIISWSVIVSICIMIGGLLFMALKLLSSEGRNNYFTACFAVTAAAYMLYMVFLL